MLLCHFLAKCHDKYDYNYENYNQIVQVIYFYFRFRHIVLFKDAIIIISYSALHV